MSAPPIPGASGSPGPALSVGVEGCPLPARLEDGDPSTGRAVPSPQCQTPPIPPGPSSCHHPCWFWPVQAAFDLIPVGLKQTNSPQAASIGGGLYFLMTSLPPPTPPAPRLPVSKGNSDSAGVCLVLCINGSCGDDGFLTPGFPQHSPLVSQGSGIIRDLEFKKR